MAAHIVCGAIICIAIVIGIIVGATSGGGGGQGSGGQSSSPPRAPVACPEKSVSEVANRIADCACLAGYAGPSEGPCKLCLENMYCPGGSQQINCPEHSTSRAGTSSALDCSCVPGFQGQPGGSCSLCSAGFYCPGGNQNLACPSYSTSADGSKSIRDCICVGGFYEIDDGEGTCEQCPAGWWCESEVATECPDGATSAAGSSAKLDCTCEGGFYGPAGGDNCQECNEGFFCTGGEHKERCPRHKTSPGKSSSLKACQAIPGYSVDAASGQAVACPIGTYKEVVSDTSPCLACGFGSSTAGTASTSVSDCVCLAGYHGPDGSPCARCPANSFCTGGTHVGSCQDGSTSPVGSGSQDACECDPGRWKSPQGDRCPFCPAGFFCGGAGIPSKCPRYSVSAAGSSKQSECLCVEGYFRDELAGVTECAKAGRVGFVVTLETSAAKFTEEFQTRYVQGFAATLEIDPARVSVESIVERSQDRRRRATLLDVTTFVVVVKGQEDDVAERMTAQKLEQNLEGTSVASIRRVASGLTSAELGGIIAGSIIGGICLSCCCGAFYVHRKKAQHNQVADCPLPYEEAVCPGGAHPNCDAFQAAVVHVEALDQGWDHGPRDAWGEESQWEDMREPPGAQPASDTVASSLHRPSAPPFEALLDAEPASDAAAADDENYVFPFERQPTFTAPSGDATNPPPRPLRKRGPALNRRIPSMRTCVICHDEFDPSDGEHCAGTAGSEGQRAPHFTCLDCLRNHIVHRCQQPQMLDGSAEDEAEAVIPCALFGAGGCDDSALAHAALLRALAGDPTGQAYRIYRNADRKRAVEVYRKFRSTSGRLLRGQRSPVETARHRVEEALLFGQTVTCPGCAVLTRKDDACIHMDCDCGVHFCYVCGRDRYPGVRGKGADYRPERKVDCGCDSMSYFLENQPGWGGFGVGDESAASGALVEFHRRRMAFFVRAAKESVSGEVWGQFQRQHPAVLTDVIAGRSIAWSEVESAEHPQIGVGQAREEALRAKQELLARWQREAA